MTYDQNNVFAKMIRGEIAVVPVLDTDLVFAITDINPQKPVHLLIMPKNPYKDISDFGKNASKEEKAAILETIAMLAQQYGLEENGYRVITNQGDHGGQEIPHLHFHVVGGEPVGSMIEGKLPKVD